MMTHLLYHGIRLQLEASIDNVTGIFKILGSGLVPFIYLYFWQKFIDCLPCSRNYAGISKINSSCLVIERQNNIEK